MRRPRRRLVVATTGLSDDQKASSRRSAADMIPIVWAPSMSMAVNLTMKLTQQITEVVGKRRRRIGYRDLERHHRFKADAPSGTALQFGELIAEKMGGEVKHVHGREGETGQRTRNEIGYHAIRVGDNPGEHSIVFGMMGEQIEINVAASNRDCYASARWPRQSGCKEKKTGCTICLTCWDCRRDRSLTLRVEHSFQ